MAKLSTSAFTVALIAALALLIGLPRAALAFGTAGLVAYAKLLVAPAVALAVLYVQLPLPYTVEGQASLVPSRPVLKVIAWLVALVTTLLLLAAAFFGVEWLVR